MRLVGILVFIQIFLKLKVLVLHLFQHLAELFDLLVFVLRFYMRLC